MAIGVPYDEYWYGDYCKFKYYEKLYEHNEAKRNEGYWLQGLYFYEALGSVMGEFAYGLGGGKGSKPKKYRDAPIPITEAEKAEAKQRNIRRTLEWVQKGQHNGND